MEKVNIYLFGGKGGVGKTTCASAQALRFAMDQQSVLLFSTDPAHSLADCFQLSASKGIRAVPNFDNLFLYEINAEEIYCKFGEEYFGEVRDIVSACTYLDEEDLDNVFAQKLPGLDELMGLKTVMDFMETKEFDVYVWDTAPTGHTLRLLSLPGIVDQWVKTIAKVKWKYINVFGRSYLQKIEEGGNLLKIKKMIKNVTAILKDTSSCTVTIVLIPTLMSIQESKRMADQLKATGIHVSRIILNHVHPKAGDCSYCHQRHEFQKAYVAEVTKAFSGIEIITIFSHPEEIRGIEQLKVITEYL
jgi:arsenite-transporting ATPase